MSQYNSSVDILARTACGVGMLSLQDTLYKWVNLPKNKNILQKKIIGSSMLVSKMSISPALVTAVLTLSTASSNTDLLADLVVFNM